MFYVSLYFMCHINQCTQLICSKFSKCTPELQNYKHKSYASEHITASIKMNY